MNKKQVKKLLKKYSNDEQIFIMIYDRSESVRLLEHLEDHKPLTDAEWLYVLRKLDHDESLWQEAYNAFHYYVERALEERKTNDDSK